MKQTATRWPSLSAPITKRIARHDICVLFLYRQLQKCDIRDCCGERRLHKVAERGLLHCNARCPSLEPLFQLVKRWRWPGIRCRLLHMRYAFFVWRKSDFANSGDETKQNSEYVDGDCAKWSDFYWHDTASNGLRANIQRRLRRTPCQHAHNGHPVRHEAFKFLRRQL